MSSYLYAVTGQAINLASVVAPSLAGDMAFRLFSTAGSPLPKGDKEKRLFAMARSSMAEARQVRLAYSGGSFVTHLFPPIGASNGRQYLVIHGWGSRIDYVQGLIRGLRQTGATVVGLDLPGHGESSGKVLTVPLAVEAIDVAWRQFGDFDAVIGHSFGGFVSAMSAAAPDGWMIRRTPKKLVIIAAPVRAEHVFRNFAGALRLSPRALGAMQEQAKRKIGQPITFFAADRMLASVPDLPVLVLHAEDDKEVSAKAAHLYAAAGPHVQLQWMNGLGHRRIVSSPEVIDRIRNFLE